MNRRLQLLFHFTAASVLGYGLYYDICNVKPPQEYLDKSINFGWKWKYLTFIDANIQLLYFAFCCIVDILTSNESTTANRTTLQSIRDTFFSTVVFPIGLFVCVTFWGLFAIDRDLVYPTILDTFIPVWLNHVMHTVILPFDLIEQAVCFHRYLSTPKGLLLSGGAMVLYALWVFYIAYRTSFWVYPVLAVLNWTFRILFILGCMALAMVFYLFGQTLNSMLWGKQEIKKSSKKRKSKKTA
ncbi:androgen-induced gene 1 protein-like isoform X2 [Artemia franciscana]|uniref:Uncharacterized protein n=2 Tax=Artemia franciscana TaxID=6661 RepID=A0AA88L9Y7_ARTSF|nr:hypothetical protein QYM36_005636 [Artemia franciscana]KAK2718393.1 hypothetical protein QYM36_005636 [Artemia franciscana]KAK2718394.1 hypothetical protein QYM36_005636 [Artemia franciscana]KAK2718395.1 hypothetical protein QYM36_005636 [Artemia franciscana]